MDNRKLSQARRKATIEGIEGKLDISNRKNKRFMITRPDGKKIHFGLYPFSGNGSFLDHKDINIRQAWRARHSKIKNKKGLAMNDPDSPEYYSYRILW